MKAGIIGYGKMGQIRAKALSEDGRIKLVSVYDAAPVEAPSGVKVASTDAEIIQDPTIDIIFVCAPNFRIVPLVKAALEAGKHVFSEKPPAFNAAEMEEVLEVEKRSGKKLMYGFNHRHHKSIIKAKEVIDTGELGKIIWMRGRYGKNVDESFFKGWRADKALSGGGILLDQGIHMLDLFRNFAGEFDDVCAMISNNFWKKDIEDNVFAIMRNKENGISASLHSTMTQWRHLFSLEIFLERGHIVLNGLKTSSGMYGDEELSIAHNNPGGNHTEEEHLLYPADKSWLSEIQHFVDCIEKDEEIVFGSSKDAYELMKLVDAVYAADPTFKR
jgi:1,5-anhydro-D-fructose reductase (1,5-anhydro-D-mannitol-forming)